MLNWVEVGNPGNHAGYSYSDVMIYKYIEMGRKSKVDKWGCIERGKWRASGKNPEQEKGVGLIVCGALELALRYFNTCICRVPKR